jgi:hypothetical protein
VREADGPGERAGRTPTDKLYRDAAGDASTIDNHPWSTKENHEIFTRERGRAPAVFHVDEDRPAAPGVFGTLGDVYLGGAAGLAPYAAGEGDADSQALIARTLEALREDARAMFAYRAEVGGRNASRKAFERSERDRKHLERMLDGQKELAQAVADLAARASARARSVSLRQIEADRHAARTPLAP